MPRPARRSSRRSSRATTSSMSSASSWPMARHAAPGRRYLIQHSAGSGKSNSIAWLAHQLIGLEHDGRRVFDSIIVVTDRVILDKQIKDTIKQFVQVGSTVTHADHSGDLRQAIEAGKKIIITTVQKFPFIYQEIGDSHRGNTFAIIIDEAHSSQGGQATSRMSQALSEVGGARGRRDVRGCDQPHHGLAQDAAQRQLLRLHRHSEEQDAGDLRRAVRGRGPDQAPAVPQLHHEAGHPGGLHPRRARQLHADPELLQARQDGRGRSRVRRAQGQQEAPPLRREQRPCDPAQGRDHGRSLPRPRPGAEQDRRQGPGDGGHQQHRARASSTTSRSAITSRSARARTGTSSPSLASPSTTGSR